MTERPKTTAEQFDALQRALADARRLMVSDRWFRWFLLAVWLVFAAALAVSVVINGWGAIR